MALFKLIFRTTQGFVRDDCPQMAAALAYYATFSLPALLVIGISVAGLVVDREDLEQEIGREIKTSIGPKAGETIETMIQQAEVSRRSIAGGLTGIAALLFGATGVMIQLQRILNRVWGVAPDPQRSGVKVFLIKRLLSIGMIFCFSIVLLVSLTVTTVLTFLGDDIREFLPKGLSPAIPILMHVGADLLITGTLLVAIYKWLPDAKVHWRDVAVGALTTTVLFIIGKAMLSLYFAEARIDSVFGAAGSLALLLVWIYFSGMLFAWGAELTKVWAEMHGRPVTPERGAIHLYEAMLLRSSAKPPAKSKDD